MTVCLHSHLHQVSEAILRTTWRRGGDGSYRPDPDEPKVLEEETGTFTCVECKAELELDSETYRILAL